MIRYFFNKETGHFIQLGNLTGEKAFSDEWVEISKQAFDYLIDLYKKSLG